MTRHSQEEQLWLPRGELTNLFRERTDCSSCCKKIFEEAPIHIARTDREKALAQCPPCLSLTITAHACKCQGGEPDSTGGLIHPILKQCNTCTHENSRRIYQEQKASMPKRLHSCHVNTPVQILPLLECFQTTTREGSKASKESMARHAG